MNSDDIEAHPLFSICSADVFLFFFLSFNKTATKKHLWVPHHSSPSIDIYRVVNAVSFCTNLDKSGCLYFNTILEVGDTTKIVKDTISTILDI